MVGCWDGRVVFFGGGGCDGYCITQDVIDWLLVASPAGYIVQVVLQTTPWHHVIGWVHVRDDVSSMRCGLCSSGTGRGIKLKQSDTHDMTTM